MTLQQVCDATTKVLGLPDENKIHRGTISAIESGLRGPSQQMLDALAIAYGMKPGDIVTDFEPREWKASA
jgi:transcriptional regulator with XRE-family HTH domain